jgi:hypothetical protein
MRNTRRGAHLLNFNVADFSRSTGFESVLAWLLDHIVPLAWGGPGTISNLQRQTIHDARAKDTWERKACGR